MLEARESAARSRAEQLREQVTALSEALAGVESELSRLQITRETISEVLAAPVGSLPSGVEPVPVVGLAQAAALLVRAHIQLQAPIVLIWDNLNTHRASGMRDYAAAHDWLTIIQLPSFAPDLNPVEGVWSLLRRGPLANTAFTDDEHLERTLRRGLRHIQLSPDLIDGCLAGTGLTLTHQPTTIRRAQ
ncbi:endonuclease [Streptomyces olivochromogenes]|uniref:Endonuclease n=1 Tax=Streptomyces olivochromogenes TaxID=1963 RepID=A0A250VUJ2_STROL|nr:endonuclease [Streptomyces olivochromogenes]